MTLYRSGVKTKDSADVEILSKKLFEYHFDTIHYQPIKVINYVDNILGKKEIIESVHNLTYSLFGQNYLPIRDKEEYFDYDLKRDTFHIKQFEIVKNSTNNYSLKDDFYIRMYINRYIEIINGDYFSKSTKDVQKFIYKDAKGLIHNVVFIFKPENTQLIYTIDYDFY